MNILYSKFSNALIWPDKKRPKQHQQKQQQQQTKTPVICVRYKKLLSFILKDTSHRTMGNRNSAAAIPQETQAEGDDTLISSSGVFLANDLNST